MANSNRRLFTRCGHSTTGRSQYRLSRTPDRRQTATTVTRTPSAIAKARPEPSVWDRFHPGAAAAQPAAPALNRFAEVMFTLDAQSVLAGCPAEAETLLRR